MAGDPQTLIEELAPLLGAKGIVTEAAAIEPWLTDWRGRYHGAAAAILAPGSTGEVAAIVRAAARAGVPLVPQGGNTSMVGGATPPADGSAVILSLRRLNRVRAIEPEAGLAVAEAGVILTTLHEAAAARGRRFPLSLGAKGSATVGGLVSTNAGGTQVLRWGTMRGLVAGLEAVLPDGEIFSSLSALKKDNRGYDVTQLLIGAEGTLGVVTAAALRLAPAISARGVAWAGVASPEDAAALLRLLQARTGAIESFEILPADALAAVLRHIAGTRAPLAAPQPWHVLIEAVAHQPGDPEPAALLAALLGEAGDLVRDAVIASNEAQADAFWRIRESISEAERVDGPLLAHDVSVPINDMPRFMIEAAREVEAHFPGVGASGYGHLGDGNIHFHVRAPAGAPADRWYAEDAPAITRFVHDRVVAAGGSISAEHGIGQMKRAELARLTPRGRLNALAAIKRALDPAGLMNPGKLLAPATAPA